MRECAAAVEANARDFPFVLFYTAEEGGDKTQRLVAQLRVTSGAPQTAEEVTADGMGPMMREVAVPSTLGLSDALSVAPTTAVLLPLCQSAAGDANAASAGTASAVIASPKFALTSRQALTRCSEFSSSA